MLYCIDMLILEPNILRDSILVRMEMTTYECYVSTPFPTPPYRNLNHTPQNPSLPYLTPTLGTCTSHYVAHGVP